tara:strand:- start:642 stop:1199 length:558 start_codon:yes stop_codon:yes gene_type:complete
MTPQRIASIEAEMDLVGLRDVYDWLIDEGNSPNMAAMLASQKPPGSWNTDADFNRRENSRMSSMRDDNLEAINKIAKRSGIATQGKTYNGQLGKYDDPAAWVSGTGDVRTAAIEKQLDIDGMVKVHGYRGRKKKTRLAKDIVDSLEYRARAKDAKLDEKCRKSDNARKALRGKLVEKHSKPGKQS